jgi:hypothetical protein
MTLPLDLVSIRRMRVHRMLNAQRTQRDKHITIWEYVLTQEAAAGSAYMRLKDGTLYMFLATTRDIAPLPHSTSGGDKVIAYLNAMYGITESDACGRFIYSQLRAHAIQHGTEVELRRFAAFNKETVTGYISAYNGQTWQIDGGTPTLVDNGTDGVFFADDDGGIGCTPDIAPHGLLLDTLTSLNFAPTGLSGITPDLQRKAMIVWLFALAFPDRMPTKPLLLIEGTQGSGKSAAVQLMQLALLGISKPMILNKNKEDDFGVQLLRSPIAVFDNTDTYIDWVADSICSYTTLGYWVKRKLFTTAEEAIIRPHAFIAIASKNPASFRREDVADRLLVLRLERREAFRPFQALQAEILALRPRLLGEYLWYLNQIVAHLRIYNDELEVAEETSRMADYAQFGRVVEAVLRWPAGTIDDMLAAMERERYSFINEDDPLVQLMHTWLKDKRNHGRVVGANVLYTELSVHASMLGVQLYKSPRTLGQKLRSPHVEEEFTVVQSAKDGHKTYQFWPRSILQVVAGGLSQPQSLGPA